MSLDGFFIHHLVDELKQVLQHGRISKIHHTSEFEMLFLIRSRSQNHKLLISANINSSHINLTTKQIDNHDTPTNFCMLIRKHFEGAIITDIRQHQNDRIILFDLSCPNEIGDYVPKKFVCEMMGRNSNIIFTLDDFQIIDAIRRLPPSFSGMRTILPRAYYEHPSVLATVNPFSVQSNETNPQDLQGVSQLFINEVKHTNNLLAVVNKKVLPVLMKTSNKQFFYCFPLSSIGGECVFFDTLSELLEYCFEKKDEETRLAQKANDLTKFVHNEHQRNMMKLEKLTSQMEEASKYERLRELGDLISANMHRIKPGDTSVTVDDFFNDGAFVTLDLNPRKTPSENLQDYFQKYRKAKTALHHLEKQIVLCKSEIDYFEELLCQLDVAGPKDIDEIRDELHTLKYVKSMTKKAKMNPAPKIDTYHDSLGNSFLVGKNNTQNNQLTHKIALKTDYWFHVKGGPGSHVIVKSENPLLEHTIRTAAQLASLFSKFRNSTSVPVDYTQVRFLKKIPGERGSHVQFSHQKTIYVDPDESTLSKLTKK